MKKQLLRVNSSNLDLLALCFDGVKDKQVPATINVFYDNEEGDPCCMIVDVSTSSVAFVSIQSHDEFIKIYEDIKKHGLLTAEGMCPSFLN